MATYFSLFFMIPRNRKISFPIFLNNFKATLSSSFIPGRNFTEDHDILKLVLKLQLLTKCVMPSFVCHVARG